MPLNHDTAAFGLSDVKVYPSNGVGGWGTGYDVPKVVEYTPSVEVGGKMLEGDDSEDLYSYIKGYGARLAFNKISVDVLSVVMGGVIADSGATPNQKTSYTFGARGTSLPLFKLEGQITKVDDDLGDAHIVLTNCRVKPGTYNISARYDNYVSIELDVWVQDQPVIEFNETAVALSTSADTTPPTVSSTTPADGAGDVVVGANLTVEFSEEIQEGDVTSNNFVLMKADGTIVACTLSLATDTVTINPDSDLDAGTAYVLVVTGVHDLAGNVLAAPVVVNFTTAS